METKLGNQKVERMCFFHDVKAAGPVHYAYLNLGMVRDIVPLVLLPIKSFHVKKLNGRSSLGIFAIPLRTILSFNYHHP